MTTEPTPATDLKREAVEFAEWIVDNFWNTNYAGCNWLKIYRNEGIPDYIFKKTSELYDLFKAQKP